MSFISGNRLVHEKDRSRSDRYHHQRLTEIRTSRNKETPIPQRMDNRKGAMLEENRKEQIERENAVLLDKMSRIMDKKPEVHAVHSVKSKRPKLLDEMLHASKPKVAEARSSYSQDRVMPNWMAHRLSMKLAAKAPQSNITTPQAIEQPELSKNPARDLYVSAMEVLNTLKQNSSLREKKQIQDRFNKPEELFERVVLYKKSCIYDDTSYLVEISAAYSKLIVLVFDMMNPKLVRRLVLTEDKTRKILNECDYDYAALAGQLIITDESAVLLRRHTDASPRRFQPGESQYSSQPPPNKKVQYERQQQFLDRNFYKETQKRKKAVQAFEAERNHPVAQTSFTIVNRLQSSHDIKPSSAISNIRKRFQFEIPEKERSRRKEKFNSTGYTSYVIREEGTESDVKGEDTLRDREQFQRQKNTLRMGTNTSKTKQPPKAIIEEKKPYLNGFMKNKSEPKKEEPAKEKKEIERPRPEKLQPFPSHQSAIVEHEGMPSISSPLSPIRPKHHSSKEDINDYDDNFDQEPEKISDATPKDSNSKQEKEEQGYREEFEPDAEYPTNKPQSRLRQTRNHDNHPVESQSEGSSQLQDPDIDGQEQGEDYNEEEYAEDEQPNNNEAQNNLEEAADNYEQDFEQRQELALSDNRSKPLLKNDGSKPIVGNPSGQYEQDFELSESHT